MRCFAVDHACAVGDPKLNHYTELVETNVRDFANCLNILRSCHAVIVEKGKVIM